MVDEKKKEWAKNMLLTKAKETGAIPKKQEFDEITRSRIKAFLGPWPRALEAAGLKPESRKQNKKRGKK